jgi:hypothetical protein
MTHKVPQYRQGEPFEAFDYPDAGAHGLRQTGTDHVNENSHEERPNRDQIDREIPPP